MIVHKLYHKISICLDNDAGVPVSYSQYQAATAGEQQYSSSRATLMDDFLTAQQMQHAQQQQQEVTRPLNVLCTFRSGHSRRSLM